MVFGCREPLRRRSRSSSSSSSTKKQLTSSRSSISRGFKVFCCREVPSRRRSRSSSSSTKKQLKSSKSLVLKVSEVTLANFFSLLLGLSVLQWPSGPWCFTVRRCLCGEGVGAAAAVGRKRSKNLQTVFFRLAVFRRDSGFVRASGLWFLGIGRCLCRVARKRS